MKNLILLALLPLLACATVQPRPEPDLGMEGSGSPGPRGVSLLSLIEGQAMAPVGSPSWLGQAYSLTLNAPSGSNGINLTSGSYICFDYPTCSRKLRWSSAFEFASGGATFTGNVSSTAGAFSSGIASGSNGLGVSTNGARIDFGAGASDYASSDGTTVTFAGPVSSGGKWSVASASGKETFDATDSSGTPGAATINKPAGLVAIAAAASSVVVTNSLVSTSSVVLAVDQEPDGTCTRIDRVVPSAGSFEVFVNAACTTSTKVGFIVFN